MAKIGRRPDGLRTAYLLELTLSRGDFPLEIFRSSTTTTVNYIIVVYSPKTVEIQQFPERGFITNWLAAQGVVLNIMRTSILIII
jgi:hypothetical protein